MCKWLEQDVAGAVRADLQPSVQSIIEWIRSTFPGAAIPGLESDYPGCLDRQHDGQDDQVLRLLECQKVWLSSGRTRMELGWRRAQRLHVLALKTPSSSMGTDVACSCASSFGVKWTRTLQRTCRRTARCAAALQHNGASQNLTRQWRNLGCTPLPRNGACDAY